MFLSPEVLVRAAVTHLGWWDLARQPSPGGPSVRAPVSPSSMEDVAAMATTLRAWVSARPRARAAAAQGEYFAISTSSGLTYASVLRIPTTSEETTKYSASYSKETTAYPQFDLFDEFKENRVNGDPISIDSKKWAYDNKYLDSSSRLYNNNYHNYHKKKKTSYK